MSAGGTPFIPPLVTPQSSPNTAAQPSLQPPPQMQGTPYTPWQGQLPTGGYPVFPNSPYAQAPAFIPQFTPGQGMAAQLATPQPNVQPNGFSHDWSGYPNLTPSPQENSSWGSSGSGQNAPLPQTGGTPYPSRPPQLGNAGGGDWGGGWGAPPPAVVPGGWGSPGAFPGAASWDQPRMGQVYTPSGIGLGVQLPGMHGMFTPGGSGMPGQLPPMNSPMGGMGGMGGGGLPPMMTPNGAGMGGPLPGMGGIGQLTPAFAGLNLGGMGGGGMGGMGGGGMGGMGGGGMGGMGPDNGMQAQQMRQMQLMQMGQMQPQAPQVPLGRAGEHVGDRINPWTAGDHYGPVLQPFLIHKLGAKPVLNPLLQPPPDDLGREYLKWNMLHSPNTCQSSKDAGNVSWSSGRGEPATFPRVTSIVLYIERQLPSIQINAANKDVGVTCGDVIDGIAHFMRRIVTKDEVDSFSPPDKKMCVTAYRRHRSTAPGMPGGALPREMIRMDLLGPYSVFGGIQKSDSLIQRRCNSDFPCAFELVCIQMPMTQGEVKDLEARQRAADDERRRAREEVQRREEELQRREAELQRREAASRQRELTVEDAHSSLGRPSRSASRSGSTAASSRASSATRTTATSASRSSSRRTPAVTIQTISDDDDQ